MEYLLAECLAQEYSDIENLTKLVTVFRLVLDKYEIISYDSLTKYLSLLKNKCGDYLVLEKFINRCENQLIQNSKLSKQGLQLPDIIHSTITLKGLYNDESLDVVETVIKLNISKGKDYSESENGSSDGDNEDGSNTDTASESESSNNADSSSDDDIKRTQPIEKTKKKKLQKKKETKESETKLSLPLHQTNQLRDIPLSINEKTKIEKYFYVLNQVEKAIGNQVYPKSDLDYFLDNRKDLIKIVTEINVLVESGKELVEVNKSIKVARYNNISNEWKCWLVEIIVGLNEINSNIFKKNLSTHLLYVPILKSLMVEFSADFKVGKFSYDEIRYLVRLLVECKGSYHILFSLMDDLHDNMNFKTSNDVKSALKKIFNENGDLIDKCGPDATPIKWNASILGLKGAKDTIKSQINELLHILLKLDCRGKFIDLSNYLKSFTVRYHVYETDDSGDQVVNNIINLDWKNYYQRLMKDEGKETITTTSKSPLKNKQQIVNEKNGLKGKRINQDIAQNETVGQILKQTEQQNEAHKELALYFKDKREREEKRAKLESESPSKQLKERYEELELKIKIRKMEKELAQLDEEN